MKLVVLTGAGISAESGLKTFRDADGLWEGYNVYDVATPEAWERNPELVQEFYNERRRQVLAAEPNRAHQLLAALEKDFDVEIITQNIDDLHERAGSTKVTHLHGVITRSQSDLRPDLTYPIQGTEIKMGDLCELGSQLRPHVVWFGEAVPMIEVAAKLCKQADIFVLIGTSLAVYPAAGLIDFVPAIVDKYIIDPRIPDVKRYKNVINIEKNAVEGVAQLNEILLNAR
ncbi:SIR2 family NAD-dependent protein deacylase [Pedobacter zeae]|uniref:NAD-dependent protein deacylase n=1 Tax=Pedobacter zeae TaxID=1737356 RepID=A0A7W6KAG9_9SPHI|nr:Sir2 family NAD-dependent protein deacetylase [Pedobacter zeae]MBB4106997.1 NAD-dependent deacetylase [Pedobacter zeae]GGH05078.1 NAD-dependent protein deacylase [Pedobacter zeae]